MIVSFWLEYLITTDGELKMAGGDTLHLEVLGCVASKLKDLLENVSAQK